MARIGIVEISTQKDDLILALNSGSSSLKFGVYGRSAGDSEEKPLLAGSAEGFGHSNGTLHIRSSDGNALVAGECIHESQSDALATLALELRDHIHAAAMTAPALNIFATSVRKVIGAYSALLGSIDLLVFKGGIGEQSNHIRSLAANGLEFLGLTTDKIQVVAAEEEQQIARHCRRMITKTR